MIKQRQKFLTPSLHWLRAFEVAARHLSFTNAADELCITQSAVSKQVRLLELHLGQVLFSREKTGLRLTESGRNFLSTVITATHSLEQGVRTFLDHTTRNKLHLKVNYGFSVFWLCDHLHEFLDLYPHVQLTLSTALWEQEFSDGVADIEIHYGKKEWFDDTAIQITEEKLFPVCTPEITDRLSSIEDIGSERILDTTGIDDNWDYWASQAGLNELEIDRRQYFGTFVLSLNLAKAGRGIALAHSTLVKSMLDNGELTIPFDLSVDACGNYFVQQGHLTSGHPDTKLFMDWITSKFPVSSNI